MMTPGWSLGNSGLVTGTLCLGSVTQDLICEGAPAGDFRKDDVSAEDASTKDNLEDVLESVFAEDVLGEILVHVCPVHWGVLHMLHRVLG